MRGFIHEVKWWARVQAGVVHTVPVGNIGAIGSAGRAVI